MNSKEFVINIKPEVYIVIHERASALMLDIFFLLILLEREMSTSKPAMSTQVEELPNSPPSNSKVEEDPLVSDVISEMEREFISQPLPPRQFNYPTPAPSAPAAPTPLPREYKPHSQNKYVMNDDLLYGIDKNHLQIAILAAALAFTIFYPVETGFLYEKIPMFSKLEPYDRIIRTLLLAVLFYVLLWKLT